MKSFKVEPWGQRVYVSSDSKKVMARYNNHAACVEKETAEDFLDCRGCAYYLPAKGRNKVLFMYYVSPSWSPLVWDDLSTLFHEALHMAHYLMEYCGAPINLDSTETQAYLMEHIALMARKKLI